MSQKIGIYPKFKGKNYSLTDKKYFRCTLNNHLEKTFLKKCLTLLKKQEAKMNMKIMGCNLTIFQKYLSQTLVKTMQ
jgi:hypothetical protein